MIDVLSTLNLKCSIQRPTQAVATSGMATLTWTTTASNVPFSMRQPSGSESVRYGRESVRNTLVLNFLPSASIDERDRVVFGTRTYDVQTINYVYDDITGLSAYIEAFVEETK